MEATSPLPEIRVLETTLGLWRPAPLDTAFVAVCDTVLMASKGERRRGSVAEGSTLINIGSADLLRRSRT